MLLNPALALFIAALLGFHRTQREQSGPIGRIGVRVGVLGLAMMLVGNVAEFWVFKPLYGPRRLVGR